MAGRDGSVRTGSGSDRIMRRPLKNRMNEMSLQTQKRFDPVATAPGSDTVFVAKCPTKVGTLTRVTEETLCNV